MSQQFITCLFNDAAYYKGQIKRHDKLDTNTSKFLSKNITARATLHALKADNEMKGNMQKIHSRYHQLKRVYAIFHKGVWHESKG